MLFKDISYFNSVDFYLLLNEAVSGILVEVIMSNISVEVKMSFDG